MRMQIRLQGFTQNKKKWLLAVLLLGFVCRLFACFWGKPYCLHPDEGCIVNNAIDLIKRHSYEVNYYNRPDHFEIKCCAVLFQVVSYARYHVGAEVAFAEHPFVFYLVARMFTAFFGACMIPLAYQVLELLKKGAGLAGAAWVAFCPFFIQHSAYATPDIVLAFWVLLAFYFSLLYLQEPEKKWLAFLCMAAGVCITIKYTGAVCCIWIAVVACMSCLKRKQPLGIVTYGVYSLLAVFGTCFFLAPNLFTNLPATIAAIQREARSVHLGADGLGFLGNLQFYFQAFFASVGWESILLWLAGIWSCIKNKKIALLGFGGLFWICTSIPPLHWERWGIPVFVFFVLLIAFGQTCLADFIKKKKRAARVAVCLYVFLVVGNVAVSGLLTVQNACTKEARVDAIDFCKEKGITKENALYEGYTPLSLTVGGTFSSDNADENHNLVLAPGMEYIVLSSSMYGRYYAEPEKYADMIAAYEAVEKECTLLYEKGGEYYQQKEWAVLNFIYSMKGLASHSQDTLSGPVIKIYQRAGIGDRKEAEEPWP